MLGFWEREQKGNGSCGKNNNFTETSPRTLPIIFTPVFHPALLHHPPCGVPSILNRVLISILTLSLRMSLWLQCMHVVSTFPASPLSSTSMYPSPIWTYFFFYTKWWFFRPHDEYFIPTLPWPSAISHPSFRALCSFPHSVSRVRDLLTSPSQLDNLKKYSEYIWRV